MCPLYYSIITFLLFVPYSFVAHVILYIVLKVVYKRKIPTLKPSLISSASVSTIIKLKKVRGVKFMVDNFVCR